GRNAGIQLPGKGLEFQAQPEGINAHILIAMTGVAGMSPRGCLTRMQPAVMPMEKRLNVFPLSIQQAERPGSSVIVGTARAWGGAGGRGCGARARRAHKTRRRRSRQRLRAARPRA